MPRYAKLSNKIKSKYTSVKNSYEVPTESGISVEYRSSKLIRRPLSKEAMTSKIMLVIEYHALSWVYRLLTYRDKNATPGMTQDVDENSIDDGNDVSRNDENLENSDTEDGVGV